MTLAEFFSEFETTVSLPPGTVQGQERLDSIERWDSFAVVEFMSMADEKLGVQLEPRTGVARVEECRRDGLSFERSVDQLQRDRGDGRDVALAR